MILTRPIATIDFETTGISTETDRICQFAITIINTDFTTQSISKHVNPGVPIPLSASKIHGITDDMVKDAENFAYYGPIILETIKGTDILTYNGNRFDIPLLLNELKRIGIEWDYTEHVLVDVFQIVCKVLPRTLSAIFEKYFSHPMKNAHNAEADTEATAAVFIEQLRVHPEIPGSMEEIALFCNDNKPIADLSGKFYYNDRGEPCFNLGKHKDKTIEYVVQNDNSYFDWFLNKDFPSDSKKFLASLLNNNK